MTVEDTNPKVNRVKQLLNTKSKHQQTIYPLKSSTNTFHSVLDKKKSPVFTESVCSNFKTGNIYINIYIYRRKKSSFFMFRIFI